MNKEFEKYFTWESEDPRDAIFEINDGDMYESDGELDTIAEIEGKRFLKVNEECSYVIIWTKENGSPMITITTPRRCQYINLRNMHIPYVPEEA